MATLSFSQYQPTITKADTSATPNTIPLRDNNGGVTHSIVTTTSLVTGSTNQTLVNKTAAYTLTANETVCFVSASTGAVTITLPALSGLNGRRYEVFKTDSSANTVTVNTPDGSTINGTSTNARSTMRA